MGDNGNLSHVTGSEAGRFHLGAAPVDARIVPDPDGTMRPLKYFVVEDNAVIRQNLVATLHEILGLECVGHAEDERGGVDWVRGDGACDLVIIDIFLKSGSGLEVLRHARAARPRTQLVVLTNYATSDMRNRCLQLGADRVFDKSAELEELLAYCEGLSQAGEG